MAINLKMLKSGQRTPAWFTFIAVVGLSWGLVGLTGIQAQGQGVSVRCGRSRQEITRCQWSRGDVFLDGQQGIMHTLRFPDGDVRYWFDPGMTLCEEMTIRVKANQGRWFNAASYCQDGILFLGLPSGNIFLWQQASD